MYYFHIALSLRPLCFGLLCLRVRWCIFLLACLCVCVYMCLSVYVCSYNRESAPLNQQCKEIKDVVGCVWYVHAVSHTSVRHTTERVPPNRQYTEILDAADLCGLRHCGITYARAHERDVLQLMLRDSLQMMMEKHVHDVNENIKVHLCERERESACVCVFLGGGVTTATTVVDQVSEEGILTPHAPYIHMSLRCLRTFSGSRGYYSCCISV